MLRDGKVDANTHTHTHKKFVYCPRHTSEKNCLQMDFISMLNNFPYSFYDIDDEIFLSLILIPSFSFSYHHLKLWPFFFHLPFFLLFGKNRKAENNSSFSSSISFPFWLNYRPKQGKKERENFLWKKAFLTVSRVSISILCWQFLHNVRI